jgi:hypothetical protein
MKTQREDGAVHTINPDRKVISTLLWHHAFLHEITLPTLDSASKDPAQMTVKIAPEWTVVKLGGGSVLANRGISPRWARSNFRLNIQGLEEACTGVNRIEAITLRTEKPDDSGQERSVPWESLITDFPNLVISIPESHAEAFRQWHEHFVVRGENGQDKEKGGTLEYLTPDLKTFLFKLTFHSLGIFRLVREKSSRNVPQLRAEMYCEKIDFAYNTAAVAVTARP